LIVNSLPGITSYSSIALSYQPRSDGTVLTDSIDTLVKNRQYINIPFIIGDQEDEGTLFPLTQTNITTTDQLINYIHTYLLQDATRTQVANIVTLYLDDPSASSPFRTGILNNIYPQYKRLAAIAGNITFNMQRRILLNLTSQLKPGTPSWSYLVSYDYGTPLLGTFHASDIPPAFGETPGTIPSLTIQSYYLSFVNSLNPNTGAVGLSNWPQWSSGKQLMNFNLLLNNLIADNFRQKPSDYIAA
jgi:acetylcholinesterase